MAAKKPALDEKEKKQKIAIKYPPYVNAVWRDPKVFAAYHKGLCTPQVHTGLPWNPCLT